MNDLATMEVARLDLQSAMLLLEGAHQLLQVPGLEQMAADLHRILSDLECMFAALTVRTTPKPLIR